MHRFQGRPLEEIVVRLRMIHALLAVVIAKEVCYTGPLRGWERTKNWDWKPLAWWPVTADLVEAKRGYYCHREV